MGTPLKEVYDMVITTMQDYRLEKLYTLDQVAYYSFLKAFLLKATTYFTKCKKSLEIDEENDCFVETLSQKEIVILSDYTIIQWFRREVNNVLSYNSQLSNNEFKRFSEAQNLKEKKDYLILMEEKVSQDENDYIIQEGSWLENFKM